VRCDLAIARLSLRPPHRHTAAMNSSARRLSHDDYTVACLCPIGVELAAVERALDEIDENLPGNRDKNGYTLGRMGVHNVVVATMPEIGNNRAAVVATQLLNDFPSIRFRSLVGIGGGIPGEDDDRHVWRCSTVRHGKGLPREGCSSE
jgi:hypothetical protein